MNSSPVLQVNQLRVYSKMLSLDFRAIFFPVTPGITRSALRIPVPMGPNPGRWSYGVVAVLDERYGISDHPVTTVPP